MAKMLLLWSMKCNPWKSLLIWLWCMEKILGIYQATLKVDQQHKYITTFSIFLMCMDDKWIFKPLKNFSEMYTLENLYHCNDHICMMELLCMVMQKSRWLKSVIYNNWAVWHWQYFVILLISLTCFNTKYVCDRSR